MRYRNIGICRTVLPLILLLAALAVANSPDLDWWTVDGGGALLMTGGNFTLSSTIGQPDATATAALTGGGFTLTGGFWSVVVPPCASFVAPDFDMDCDVDLSDYAAFESCISGPEISYGAGCGGKDLDIDGDVDLFDFDGFQQCFSGEGVLADAACLD